MNRAHEGFMGKGGRSRGRAAPAWLPLLLGAVLAAMLLSALLPGAARGQEIFDPTVELDFDDPEAWAMKFFTSASLQTSLGPVRERLAGSVDLGVELISIPHLDREQRTVGFGGFKEEDLNRSPAWARLRAELGIGAGWGLVLGWTPPVEVDGVKANLLSLALERSLWRSEGRGLGLRIYGQGGEASGDLTCTAGGDERFPPGSPDNPFGCEGPSDDEITMEYYGVELVADFALGLSGRTVLHAGISVNELDMEFQVDARTFGFVDRSRLVADGQTFAATLGFTWDLGARGRLGAELFYTPLDVVRGGEVESDDLLNLRLGWRLAVR